MVSGNEMADIFLKDFFERYKSEISAGAMQSIYAEAESMFHAIMSLLGTATPGGEIRILINPQKVDVEMLFRMADDWTSYVTAELGLDPKDAIMITPF